MKGGLGAESGAMGGERKDPGCEAGREQALKDQGLQSPLSAADIHAEAKRLARQVMKKYGRPAGPTHALVELFGDLLEVVEGIREDVQEVAQIVQKGVAGSGQEGVMDDVNATLPAPEADTASGSRRGPLKQGSAIPIAGIGDPGGVMTAREIASLLRVDRKTVTRWLAAGEMPAPIAVKGVRRWRRGVIEAWLLDREGS